jgi:F-type H+-transporting ATPase subunit alpha
VQFASDLDAGTRARISRGIVLTEILKQGELMPLPFELEVLSIYMGINGHLDGTPKEKVGETVAAFLDYVKKMHENDVVKPLREAKELKEEVVKAIDHAIASFKATQK